ncbi:Hypothetical Protein SLY_1108 [Strawberry lethal yellows phytoplasma (CPA) str. NZSb11]|uniref:DUF2963 domain-containing protein n=1 Tax=Strawberry lethal yellows phytoplasma (CPA) str. NZSb11 TaxID=980422 RepID=R4S2G9_PHYAS|nr:Hypothetical Protein SLY_1108 [Strawberry lethal yellows phytoplasma (CPA) str. NZSb11]
MCKFEFNPQTGKLTKQIKFINKDQKTEEINYNDDGKTIKETIKYEYNSETGKLTKQTKFNDKDKKTEEINYKSDGKTVDSTKKFNPETGQEIQ